MKNLIKKKRILIVDDDAGILIMLKLLLQLEGYEPSTCGDPTQVLDRLVQEKPDLVLMDAMMPQMDGLQVIAQVKARHLPNCPPIILLTGNVDEAYSKQALQKGATGIIIKPFIKEDLLGKIGSFLQRQGQDTIC
jgi:DNA-binding response OmpR family regulator